MNARLPQGLPSPDPPGVPDRRPEPADRWPTRPTCPICGGVLSGFLVVCDGHRFEVGRCRDHGDVGGPLAR